ncbi:unnamed protein product, partial [Mesorhabditis belari]|uniref:Uncharacterized protein n=1 Tax=Mesorhabditis belari TaxID=2138241 RepID=A0AAF3EPS5_9BILA
MLSNLQILTSFCFLYISVARPTEDAQIIEQNVTVPDPKGRDHEKAFQRTISVVQYRSAFGRIVLLICQRPCKLLRSSIPQVVRDYNEEKSYSSDDLIYYHYHYLRQSPLPFYNMTSTSKEPIILYISAGNVKEFHGELSNKVEITSWLQKVDKIDVFVPKTSQELDNYLTDAENCEKSYLLIVHDSLKCPFDYWMNVARVVYSGTQVPTILLERPMENAVEVTLYRRLFSLPQQCLIVSLIHNNQYTQPFTELAPDAIVDTVRDTLEYATCNHEENKVFTKSGIRASLTDLQMEYFVREVDLKKLEHKTAYIAVGLAGGIAVIALAISIFWGLNGSAFTRE